MEWMLESFFQEALLEPLALNYITKAVAQGYPQIAKLFRALLASENVRQRLIRKDLTRHVVATFDYYVCIECSLIFAEEAPEICPLDNTPEDQFKNLI